MADELIPRARVYALARTQLDWIPTIRSTLHTPEGFAHEKRFVSCPDCLTNGRVMPSCESCHGRGEIPDPGRDPMDDPLKNPPADDRRKTYFGGRAGDEARDRARMTDSTITRLEQLARVRDGDEHLEDWLTRALRLKDAQHRRGDYRILELAQQKLNSEQPMRYLAWMLFVCEGQLSARYDARHRLDETADWLAERMTETIRERITEQHQLGIRRTRPEAIQLPAELNDQALDAAGKGRWANPHTQGQRNALVAALAHDGKTAGEIAKRVGLTKRRVQQLLADLPMIATGPAA